MHAQRIRFVFSANQMFRFDSEHEQNDGESVNSRVGPSQRSRAILGADLKERGLWERE